MIREDDFRISGRLYAVDLSTFQVDEVREGHDGPYAWAGVDAVWFRRRQGLTAACVGRLRDSQSPPPADVAAFLDAFTDGRYGGDCVSRLAGVSFWSASQDPETTAAHLVLLRGMLDGFPTIPDGYSGWWRF